MNDSEPRVGSAEIRAVLAASAVPMSISEILAKCETIETSTQIASMLFEEVRSERATREGTRGLYRYSITEAGRLVVDNPRFLRGRGARRMHGRGLPPARQPSIVDAAETLAQAIVEHERTHPPADASPEGLSAAGWIPPERIVESLISATASSVEAIQAANKQLAATYAATSNSQNETATRLAAAVLSHWPGALIDIPPELRERVFGALETARAAA